MEQNQSEESVKKMMTRATQFFEKNCGSPTLGNTYGYFTKHPFASLNQKRLKVILNHIDKHSRILGRPLRILDLACGGGLIASAIANEGHRVVGIDLNGEEIQLANSFKTFQSPQNGSIEFFEADLLADQSWENKTEAALQGKPDLVTLAYALHHLPSVEKFAGRLSEWLDPGALLLINEENPDSPVFRLKHRLRTWIQRDTANESHRTFQGWKELFESRKFRVNPPTGVDLIGLFEAYPSRCCSLVFTAERIRA